VEGNPFEFFYFKDGVREGEGRFNGHGTRMRLPRWDGGWARNTVHFIAQCPFQSQKDLSRIEVRIVRLSVKRNIGARPSPEINRKLST
jgi:hypothetical protein